MEGHFVFNFPPFVHEGRATECAQAAHIKREAKEVWLEAVEVQRAEHYGREGEKIVAETRMAVEAMDCIHACETLLRAIDGRIKMDDVREYVIKKNAERGYYGDACE